MKLGTIVTATDATPLYADFIPLFIRAWSHVVPEADIHILYIAETLPEALQPYAKHIRLIPPIPGLHTAFHAQCIRLLYPREITRDEGVLITDMDMLPLNRSYYVSSIASAPSDAFVVYRDACLPAEIAMCYNAAHPSTWSAVFGAEPTESLLQTWADSVTYDGEHGGSGWNTDQLKLVAAVQAWSGPTVMLTDAQTKFARLDRSLPLPLWESHQKRIRELILQGYFADYHCLRPYSEFRALNEWVMSCLQQTNGRM
jgi:hypothetical protein